jgi:hypothetical protein
VEYPEVIDQMYDLWVRMVRGALAFEADRPEAQLRVARARLVGEEPSSVDLSIVEGGHWTVPVQSLAHPGVWMKLQLATRVGNELHINQEEVPKYFT